MYMYIYSAYTYICICLFLFVWLCFFFLQGLSALVKERPPNPYTHMYRYV